MNHFVDVNKMIGRKLFILFNNEFLKSLQKDLGIDINLEMNREMLNKGMNKLNTINKLTIALVYLNDKKNKEYLNIKTEEYPIFEKFLNNIKERIILLEQLRKLKEREIDFTNKHLKL